MFAPNVASHPCDKYTDGVLLFEDFQEGLDFIDFLAFLVALF